MMHTITNKKNKTSRGDQVHRRTTMITDLVMLTKVALIRARAGKRKIKKTRRKIKRIRKRKTRTRTTGRIMIIISQIPKLSLIILTLMTKRKKMTTTHNSK